MNGNANEEVKSRKCCLDGAIFIFDATILSVICGQYCYLSHLFLCENFGDDIDCLILLSYLGAGIDHSQAEGP
jgi:hypothetical protein